MILSASTLWPKGSGPDTVPPGSKYPNVLQYIQYPMKEAGEAFPSYVTEGETEAQRREGIIVFGTSGPTQFPTLGLTTGIKVAELK